MAGSNNGVTQRKTAELADVSFIHGMRFPEVQLLCFITTWGIIIKVSVLTTP